jgi:hypothetical protein
LSQGPQHLWEKTNQKTLRLGGSIWREAEGGKKGHRRPEETLKHQGIREEQASGKGYSERLERPEPHFGFRTP